MSMKGVIAVTIAISWLSLGADGCMERVAYAPLLGEIWRAHKAGDNDRLVAAYPIIATCEI